MLEDILIRAERPSRYVGNEYNSIKKPFDETQVRVALVYPDAYEVGMSHVGLRILYHLLNSLDFVLAERAFSPWPDMSHAMRKKGVPLITLESHRPLRDFDVVGFSLQHELAITNVLEILALSHIKALWEQRHEEAPLIIAGGPACFNPEPFCGIFDAIVIGDGEEVSIRICELVRDWKKAKGSKEELLVALTKVEGVYIPKFFEPISPEPSRIEEIRPLLPGYERVKKALLKDLDKYPFPSKQVVPFTQLIHDRFVVEISRGCSRGCRFCQAGMIYRPLRERAMEQIVENVTRGLEDTGYEEVSLLSLSSGDYSCIQGLIKHIMDRNERKKIALSLPSLRVDTMNAELMEQIKRVRKTGFTIAPETGMEELRFRLNKQLTDKEILDISNLIFEAGWQVLKLYFMVGLPFETDDALKALPHLVSKILKGTPRKGKLHLNISCFVPKSHTPFQWEGQVQLDEFKRRYECVARSMPKGKVFLHGNLGEQSWLEGVFSRGDRRLLLVALKAHEKGASFDAWGDLFNLNIWYEAFKETGIDPTLYLRKRDLGELMPWSHIDTGIKGKFLLDELRRAEEAKVTPPCTKACSNCGVCNEEGVQIKLTPPTITLKESPEERPHGNEVKKILLVLTKLKKAKYLGHLEFMRTLHRAMRRAGLNLIHSEGYHPMPKVRFGYALPLGMESLNEVVEMEIYDSHSPKEIRRLLNKLLPSGIRVKNASYSHGLGSIHKEGSMHFVLMGEDVGSYVIEKIGLKIGSKKGDDSHAGIEIPLKDLVLERRILKRDVLMLKVRYHPKIMKFLTNLLSDGEISRIKRVIKLS